MKIVSTLCRGLLATAFSLVLFTSVSAADFEGRIHMDVTSGKKKEAAGIDYAIKNGKMRMDMPQQEGSRRGGGAGGIIIDYPNMEMFILMEHDGQKNYMRRSLADTVAKASERNQEHRTPPPVATGRTEMIAGYTATEYTTTNEKGEVTEMWLAKGLGRFMGMSGQNPMGGRGAPSPEWENFARDGNLFPLRVVSRNAKGAEVTRMEVTKIEKTSLPDSLFSTDGYSEFKMPDFGGLNPFKH